MKHFDFMSTLDQVLNEKRSDETSSSKHGDLNGIVLSVAHRIFRHVSARLAWPISRVHAKFKYATVNADHR